MCYPGCVRSQSLISALQLSHPPASSPSYLLSSCLQGPWIYLVFDILQVPRITVVSLTDLSVQPSQGLTGPAGQELELPTQKETAYDSLNSVIFYLASIYPDQALVSYSASGGFVSPVDLIQYSDPLARTDPGFRINGNGLQVWSFDCAVF